jgi:L-lactate utilization protein LutB
MNSLIFNPPQEQVTPENGELRMYENNKDECRTPQKCITCPHCGEQIPMEPSLSDMIQAIENHLSTHKEGAYPKHDPLKRPSVPSLSEDLTEQVLIRAAEIGESLSKEPTITLHPAEAAQ